MLRGIFFHASFLTRVVIGFSYTQRALTSRTRLRTEYIRREREGSERDRERPRTSENQASKIANSVISLV